MPEHDLRRLAAAVALAAATVAVAAGCASAPSSSSASRSGDAGAVTPSSWPSAGNDPAVLAAAAKIRPLLESRYAAQFTAVVLKQDAGVAPVLEVRRVPGTDLDAFVRAQVPSVPVDFIDTAFSEQQIQQLEGRITADTDYWNTHGVTVIGAGPGDAVTCEVEVWTPDGSPAETAAFRSRYGTSAVKAVAHAAVVADSGKVPAAPSH